MTKLLYDKFVLGKENSGKSGSLFGAATYDEMEFWYGTRDYLLANNYIQRGNILDLWGLFEVMMTHMCHLIGKSAM